MCSMLSGFHGMSLDLSAISQHLIFLLLLHMKITPEQWICLLDTEWG